MTPGRVRRLLPLPDPAGGAVPLARAGSSGSAQRAVAGGHAHLRGPRRRARGDASRPGARPLPGGRRARAPGGRHLRLRPGGPPVLARHRPRRRRPGAPSRSSGPTGSGKTTLTQLIPRFYDADGGARAAGRRGRARPAPRRPAPRGRRGLPGPLPVLGTIVRENIAYGAPEATDEEVREAAAHGPGRRASSRRCPRATTPSWASAATRSRAASASASPSPGRIITDPRVLILDEATASVDASTEREIQAALRGGHGRAHDARSSPTASPRSPWPTSWWCWRPGRVGGARHPRGALRHQRRLPRDPRRRPRPPGPGREGRVTPGAGSASSVLGRLADPRTTCARWSTRGASCASCCPTSAPTAARAVFTVFLMLVVTACGLAGAGAGRSSASTTASRPHDKAMLLLAVGLFVVAGLVGWRAGYLQSYLSSWVGERVLLDLRTDTFRHLMRPGARLPRAHAHRLDGEPPDQRHRGPRPAGHRRRDLAGGQRADLLRRHRDPLLLRLEAGPPVVRHLPRARRRARRVFRVYSTRAYRRTRERVADVLATLQETISGIRVVQGFGRQEPAARDFAPGQRRVPRGQHGRRSASSGIYFPGVELLAAIGTAIILYFGGGAGARPAT